MSPSNFETVWLSPDGRRAAVVRATSPTSSDLWLLTMDRYVLTRLTYSPGRVDRVVWSPDGKRVAFANDRNGRWDLFEKVVDDAAPEKPILVSGSLIKYPSDYTSDGATLIFEQLGERTGWDVFQMRLEGDRTPQPLVVTSYDEQNARVSPDGRWLAFASNESGRTEIHVQGYAAPGRRQQVSSQGGVFPIWRADGGRLMFIAVAGPTSVEVTESGNEIRFGPARQAAIRPGTIHGSLMPDLQRALLILPADSGPVRDDLTLVLNWRTELKQH